MYEWERFFLLRRWHCLIAGIDYLLLVTQSNFYNVSLNGKYLNIGEKFKVKISIKWGAITYFHLTQPWLLRIMYELSSEKIIDGNWPQGDNRELRIETSDC